MDPLVSCRQAREQQWVLRGHCAMDRRVQQEQLVSRVRLKTQVQRAQQDLREQSRAQQEQRVRKTRGRRDPRVKQARPEQLEHLAPQVRWEFPVLLDLPDSLQAQQAQLDC